MMSPSPVVVDAGVLIAVLDGSDPHSAWAQAVVPTLGPRRLLTNALTLAEAIVHSARARTGAATLGLLTDMIFSVTSLHESDALPLAELRATTRLRMPDAVVLHTALTHGAAIATTDVRLARIAREHGVAVHAPDDQ